MALKTFATLFTESELARLPITISDGLGITLDAPGTYTLRALQGWFIGEDDEMDVDDMDAVIGGDDYEIIVTPDLVPYTAYLKLHPVTRVGQTEVVTIRYDVPDVTTPALPGPGTFTLKSVNNVLTWVEDV